MRRPHRARTAAIFAGALALAGCHPGIFAASYSVAWPKASNDVRAWGTQLIAAAQHRWHGAVTVELDPIYFDGRGTQRIRGVFVAGGYLRAQGAHWAFTPVALRASVPCGEPDELGKDCRRFAVGRIASIDIEDYSYQSKTFETGIAFRTLSFRFRAIPAGAFGILLATHRALVCQTGERTTTSGTGPDRSVEYNPVYSIWTARTWCETALQTENGTAKIPALGPMLPIPGLTGE